MNYYVMKHFVLAVYVEVKRFVIMILVNTYGSKFL